MNNLKPENFSILRLNVGGKSFLISKSTALRHGQSLLAALVNGKDQNVPLTIRTSIYILEETGEYFVERSPLLFDLVLQYARTGRVQCPASVCEHALREELSFWRLRDNDNGRRRRRLRSIMAAAAATGDLNDDQIEEISEGGCMTRLWRLFEYPQSSTLAKVINSLCVFFILTSIINFVASTEPSLRSSCVDDSQNHTNNQTTTNSPLSKNTADNSNSHPQTNCRHATNDWYFDIVEAICTVWFTLEFFLRFISCPFKIVFIRSPLNIIDFLATIPFCIEMLAYAAVGGHRYINSRNNGAISALLILMRVLRIIRVVRSFRLARYINSFQLLCALAWNSRGDFGLLLLFLSVGTLIFSSLIYYAEKDEKNTAYTSIPASFWWCVVTFSTVGYGDVTPTTVAGRILAGIACISGILIITFPVSIITDTFRCTYEAHKIQRRRRRAVSHEQKRRSALTPAVSNVNMKSDYNAFVETKL